MVFETMGEYFSGRNPSFREHLYRDVLRFDFSLASQILLCLRLHVARLHHSQHSICLCDHCFDLFPIEHRGLQMALDILSLLWFHRSLCISLLDLLFLRKDFYVRIFPNRLLLWLYVDVLLRISPSLRLDGFHWHLRLCSTNLSKYQKGLKNLSSKSFLKKKKEKKQKL